MDSCGRPPSTEFATYVTRHDVPSGRDVATYRCSDGYMFEFGLWSFSIMCQQNGQWEEMRVACEQVGGRRTTLLIELTNKI